VNHALSRHVRFCKGDHGNHAEIPHGLLRAYAKYCLSQRQRQEAKAALHLLTAGANDLQSLLLLGAIYELERNADLSSEYFVRAADLHAHSVSIASSTELFRVFSHSDHRISD
jgi:hypothetical protein